MDGLVVAGVGVSFDGDPAVQDVTLELPAGQVLAVLGPSGCGKSTLLRVIAGLQVPDRGTVSFDGADVTGIPTHKRGFALMFQDGQLFAHLDVAANVAYPLRRKRVARAKIAPRVTELLNLVGLPGMEERGPASLSGGQQQRVALARALAAEPRLLLLDEPLSALDRALRDRLATDLREILVCTGTTALLVTHDHDEALTAADRIAVMRDGRIVQQGPAADVWQHPVDERAAQFLGFSTILDGSGADRLRPLLGAGAGRRIALRPGALRVDPRGELIGTVRSAATVADGIRLRCEVEAIGEVQAYAETGTTLAPGDRVQLRLVPAATAALPEGPAGR
ncbi:ABC transporter ATP-binding protein [Leekyejoonella antrihumi]|uniref:ABC-type quaternary amine transporter n=1 Tax=Leekyejoonella antrihumi TaxID=1660198 RepID=A0A563E9Q9_9MICO|nr:ABC transporter ATP-binding protein [Leekyejoonella antrihumi]TWP39059.1 ABC transporter ATP-binding protein [Leekyejoonella antrihumi]